MQLDALTRSVLDKPAGHRTILTVSDGVLKGADVSRMAADCRAQESIRPMTARILTETEKEPMHMTRA